MQNNLKVFDFIKARKLWLTVYAIIIVATFIVVAIFGANLSIDFKGGTDLNYSFTGDIDLDKAEAAIEEAIEQKVSVSENKNFNTGEKSLVVTLSSIEAKIVEATKTDVLKTLNEKLKNNKITAKSDANSKDNELLYSFEGDIKDADANAVVTELEKVLGLNGIAVVPEVKKAEDNKTEIKTLTVTIPSAIESTVTAKLAKTFPNNNIKNIRSNTVSGTIAANFFLKCLVAVILAGALVILYVGIRFRKIGGVSAGMFALLALLLDCFAAFAASVFFRLEIDSNFMSVILTTLGYSLNDTIVIYDRIRENARLYPEMDLRERINLSISQSLGRTIKTALATFLAIFAVVIVAEFYGLTTLRSFAIPMAVGILSGCISTLFLSSPLWYSWKKYSDAKKANK